jgi:glutathione-regulated potassium-efflux system ancillary protein KefC
MGHGLLRDALIFLAAAVVFVPLFLRLGLGSVLGYLIGGLVIGPWGAGFIHDVEHVMHFSEFGVVLFLFLVGLELEPRRLWSLRVPIFGMGTAQVLGCAAVIASAGLALGVTPAAALVAGLGLALSSTAIALQVMKERDWLETRGGNSAFSILLFQDIAVIPMLAVLPMLAPGAGAGSANTASPAWQGALLTVGVLAGVVMFGRVLLRPLLRAVAAAHLREVFTALALLLVVAMAGLMQWLELSMGLGAFMAGVLLADSEYRHALETDIEPFKGLLLGLFFMSVGMSIDVGAVKADPLPVLGIVLGLTVAKLGVHAVVARLFGLPAGQRPFFALVIGQVGEFAFVLFSTAAALGVLAPGQTAPLVAAAALSMLLSPISVTVFSRFIEPRWARRQAGAASGPDVIHNDRPAVLIAGFGRFGQIVGRLLYANGVTATVLDHEPDQIELLRRFGFKVYFGDATRVDLLHAAGASDAKILVVAIDDVEAGLRLIDEAHQQFPHLKIYARARNVQHVYGLLDRPSVVAFERETFDSSLSLGAEVLRGLGYTAHGAWRAANRFRDHNLEMLRELHKLRQDQGALVARARQVRDDLTAMFERERDARDRHGEGWD